MEIRYHKFVRDRIPEIIAASGKSCSVRVLGDDEYLQMLDEKLNEETAEYQESKTLEELADILEVIEALVIARGYTVEDLLRAKAEKQRVRGGFRQKILLETVSAKEQE